MKYAFYIVFLAGIVNAADFPTDAKLEILSDWSGGLNTTVPAHKLPKNFSPGMRNVFTHRSPGKIITRSGFIALGSTLSLVRGSYGFTYYHTDGSKEFLVTDSSQVLSTQDFNTYVLVSSAMNTGSSLECTQAGNKVYCTNGIDPVFTWDGTSKVNLDGTKGTPNVPKFKYIAYFQNRIFGLNTSADLTSLDWSAVVSTGGNILTPDHFLAWPVGNHKLIGGGDGQPGTSLFVYRGQLGIGKTGSIWTLFGNSDSTYIERRIESQAGIASQDSITFLDGVVYYKGFDGIYYYDGNKSYRISDLIKPDIDAMVNPISQVVSNKWDTQLDFGKGQFSNSTASADGFVTNYISSYPICYLNKSSPGRGLFLTDTSTSTISFTTLQTTNTIPSNSYVHSSYFEFFAGEGSMGGGNCASLPNTNPQLKITLLNTQTTARTEVTMGIGAFTAYRINDFSAGSVLPGLFFTGTQINNGNVAIKLDNANPTDSCVEIAAPAITQYNYILIPATTGQFISDVATNTTITSWGNFNSENTTNGGLLNFYFRTSTSVVNITTQTWIPISPGANINASILNKYIQWASSMTSTANDIATPNIDRVTIDHVEGGNSVNRPFGTDWNNEYWLSVTTDVSTNFNLQYVKSWITNTTPHAWNVMDGMNIASFFKDGSNVLYAGSYSSGTFYRLDYGTNDNGNAINAFYETPDLNLRGLFGEDDGNWIEKKLQELWIDVDKENGSTLRLGTKFDGSSYSEDTIDLSGSGQLKYILKNPSKFGKEFRFRFRNNTLDKNINFNSFGIMYSPLRTR